jgi:hypothetical protein
MSPVIQGVIGGSVPAIVMILFYFLSSERRLTRIETDITWLKKEIPACRPRLDVPTQ